MFDLIPRFLAKVVKPAFAVSVIAMGGSSWAQSFSHSDSGWVPLFNGKDYTGIYGRVYGATAPVLPTPNEATWKIMYAGTDTAAIYVTSKSDQGNIGTKKNTFSHYRMRVEEKFDDLGATNNGGITYHTDETVPRMQNNWPRSIEFQMQQQYAGAAYSIQQVTFDTKASGKGQGSRYSENGQAVVACASGCDGRFYTGSTTISNGSNGNTRWLHFELVVRGSDSAIHIIDNTVVLRLSNIRIFNATPLGPYDHGGIGLQSEGALIKYRRWEIMEFPAGTPKGENYLHRLFLDSPAKGSASISGGSTFAIKWRTLGSIPSVNIEYGTGTSGPWQSVAAGVSNTGTYEWAVPASVSGPVRVRISGPAWAGADSSNSGNTEIGKARPGQGTNSKPVSFSIEGKGEILKDIKGAYRVEIRDVFGRLVRSLSVGAESLIWDRRGSNGALAQPGIYFLRLKGPVTEKTVRSLVL